jgi:hypothetical protein
MKSLGYNGSQLMIKGWLSGIDASMRMALLGLLLLMLGSQMWRPSFLLKLTVDMAATTSADGQVFIQTSNGYAEDHSTQISIVPDGNRHKYSIEIRGDIWARHLRIDPGSATGLIRLFGVRMISDKEIVDYPASKLVDRVRPINQLGSIRVVQDALNMHSLGDDPHYEIKIPFKIYRWVALKLICGFLLAMVGILVLVLAIRHKEARPEQLVGKADHRSLFVLALVMFLAAHAALAIFGAGCDELACSLRSIGYGYKIFLAGVCCACVGAAILHAFVARTAIKLRPRFFLSLIIGQTIFILYVYLRSAQNFYLLNIPVTGYDFVLLVALAVTYLFWRWRSRRLLFDPNFSRFSWLLIELALFAALSMVIADRELPRLMMLSTDPDIHAFLAKQIERFGGIPRSQGVWGADDFNYPAGAPTLTFVWAKLSGLDMRNSLSALVLLQTLLVATLVGESVVARYKGSALQYVVIQTVLLAAMAAGLLIAFYDPFSHMEGVGRQVAFAFAAAVVVLLFEAHGLKREWKVGAYFVLPMLLFALAVMNPVNVIFPLILIAGVAVNDMLRMRQIPWRVLIPAGFVLLIMLDPYFLSMMKGSSHGLDKLDVSPNLINKTGAKIFEDWLRFYVSPSEWSLRSLFSFLPWQAYPAFGLVAGLFTLIYLSLQSGASRVSRSTLISIVACAVFLYLALGLFAAMQDDRRYYLLYPYFIMGLAYYKIIIVLMLVAFILHAVFARLYSKVAIVLVAFGLIGYIGLVTRSSQSMHFEPREHFCESGGCVATDDMAVIRQLQSMMSLPEFMEDKAAGIRILIPNVISQVGQERWAFPVGSGRILGFTDTLPIAFYYLQADPAFTTVNYVDRVCQKFDRSWLKDHRIGYVLIPSQRSGVCVSGMDSLVQTDKVVIKVGNSYLVKLVAPAP